MSINPGQSRQARIASLQRRARAAEAHGRVAETVSHLREVVQLDPHDKATLRRLGDLFRLRLDRHHEAATWYARAARANERDELPVRAIALWRTVLQCDSLHAEAHERIGALYVETGRPADARQHLERSERVLREAGRGREAAILRAQREALEETAPPPASPGARAGNGRGAPVAEPPLERPAAAVPEIEFELEHAPEPARAEHQPAAELEPPSLADAEALDLAAERLSNGRAFHHYGLHTEARRQLEEVLALLPEHVEARQLLAEVCRSVGDTASAAHHLDVLVQVMRRRGKTEAPSSADDPLALPPLEEWSLDEGEGVEEWPVAAQPRAELTAGAASPIAEILAEIDDDVERLVDRLNRKPGRG